MPPVPILFYGDSPDLQTGLGRIGRDLAVLCSSLPGFRVGYLGRGGTGSRQLPFVQYRFHESDQWGEWQFPKVWQDFAGQQKGIVFTIWDASRLHWFARPNEAMDPYIRNALTAGKFERWGYFPVDAEGVGWTLSTLSRDTLRGYDRVLGYGAWGAGVLSRSLGREVDWIPHGVKLDTWQPRDRVAARMAMGFGKEHKVVGCLMSNQLRKDWGLACAVFRSLAAKDPQFRFWLHIDQLARTDRWDLRALIADHGIGGHVKVTISGSMSDEELSYHYSGCDLTVLPSLGEGFGFPIAESLGCGVPVVHGNYGGGVELVPREDWLVEPVAWRIEGFSCSVRPVYEPQQWADVCLKVLDGQVSNGECRSAVEHLDWKVLWPSAWKKWFVEGIT